jgi:hypothetical protein
LTFGAFGLLLLGAMVEGAAAPSLCPLGTKSPGSPPADHAAEKLREKASASQIDEETASLVARPEQDPKKACPRA